MVKHLTIIDSKSKLYSQNYKLICYVGLIANGPQKFSHNGLKYNKMATPVIVNTCPFIAIDNNDENSAYGTLLLHTPWPLEGEDAILYPETTAVNKLQTLINSESVPKYVMPMLQRIRISSNFTDSNTEESHMHDGRSKQHNDEDHNEYISYDQVEEDVLTENDSLFQQQYAAIDGVFDGISKERDAYYRNFVKRAQEDYMIKEAKEHQLQDSLQQMPLMTLPIMCKVENYEERLMKLADSISTLTPGQLSAYKKAINHIGGEDPTPLIMFISGEGGTGKSFLIALIMEFTRLKYGKQKGIYGAAVAMAPTGCAANVIKGYTWQSCYSKGRSNTGKSSAGLSQLTAKKVGEKFRGTKLIVLDEISMINLENLSEISERHKQGLLAITEDIGEREYIKQTPFGGIHMLFTGDLWQLKAIGGHPIFSTAELKDSALEGRKIWHSINEYSELTENYRFKNDETTHLKDFLTGAREGKIDKSLLLKINSRIVVSRKEAVRLAHPSANWIAHTKASVKNFNECDFKEKVGNRAAHFRIIAKHSSAVQLIPHPNTTMKQSLYEISKPRGSPTYIDLAIGSRVSCVRNLGTQIGNTVSYVYNQYLGT